MATGEALAGGSCELAVGGGWVWKLTQGWEIMRGLRPGWNFGRWMELRVKRVGGAQRSSLELIS